MEKEYLEILRKEGYKITPRRIALLEYLEAKGGSVSPEEIWRHMQQQFKHYGLPGIYRNLELFEKMKILIKVYRHDHKTYYAFCRDYHNHHHHIVCIGCGKVTDIPFCNFPAITSYKGFKILGHSMQVEGLCPECQL